MVVREALWDLLSILCEPVSIRKPFLEIETLLDKSEQLLTLVAILKLANQAMKALHLHIIILLVVIHLAVLDIGAAVIFPGGQVCN